MTPPEPDLIEEHFNVLAGRGAALVVVLAWVRHPYPGASPWSVRVERRDGLDVAWWDLPQAVDTTMRRYGSREDAMVGVATLLMSLRS